jgi:beta-lactamase superfamily II metal-dependent hydrolase
VLAGLPVEVPFDDAGGTNARNNSSIVSLLRADGQRLFFPADGGVPALDRAWDWLEQHGSDATPPDFLQMPHHGSRKNASSRLLDRILGSVGQEQTRSAFVNVAPEAERHPSPRVANAFMRRGYNVFETKGRSIYHHHGSTLRPGWSPLSPIDPLDESGEE